MPKPRKYEDAAAKQMAYRIRKEKERLALVAAMLDLARAVRHARAHGAVLVTLDHIPIDDHARMIRELARAISEGCEAAMANLIPARTREAI
ncbi:MAG: hypothetical protein HY321_22140 [Armatimonadetes bacterium]|nr:hypothetical protein [Armatimonadota bacterium]